MNLYKYPCLIEYHKGDEIIDFIYCLNEIQFNKLVDLNGGYLDKYIDGIYHCMIVSKI